MTPTDTPAASSGTTGRAFKRGLRSFFLGALSLYAAHKGVGIPLPDDAGAAADAIANGINIGISLGADKAIRELWGRLRRK